MISSTSRNDSDSSHKLTTMTSATLLACSTIDAAFATIDTTSMSSGIESNDEKDSKNDSANHSETNDGVENLECARRLIRDLRSKCRSQAQQIIAWRRAHAAQELLVKKMMHEKNVQMSKLSSQLFLFESRLMRKQKEIGILLNQRETTILRQQRIIDALTNRLIDNGLEPPTSEIESCNMMDFDSLNDSDSAVVMEEVDSDCNLSLVKYRSGNSDNVTIVRSISDAIETNLKYSSVRRSNCYLRRPDILETVYSVEEDTDNDPVKTEANAEQTGNKTVEQKRDKFKNSKEKPNKESFESTGSDEKCKSDDGKWSFSEKIVKAESPLSDKEKSPKTQVTTYNRVMSNHRSVTKPKDVKYKRINKAKSKSLEELRGRLRNWVEKGNRVGGVTLEQSQSYA